MMITEQMVESGARAMATTRGHKDVEHVIRRGDGETLVVWQVYAEEVRAALTAALQDSVVVPAEVREIVDLYFAPWGAAKGARWEALSGDQPFNAEIAMSLIEAALPRHERSTPTRSEDK
jgi:hypothetical protein